LLGGEPSVSKCCLLGLLVSSSSDVMSGSKQDAISVFVKAVVMSKTTPPLAALVSVDQRRPVFSCSL